MTDSSGVIEPAISEPDSISSDIASAWDAAAAELPTEPVRGEDGKFASQETPADAVEEPAKEEKPAASAEEDKEPAIEPPALLGAAAKERWSELPRELQEELKASLDGAGKSVEQEAKKVAELEPLKAIFEPHAARLAAQGISQTEAVRRLLAVEDALTKRPAEILPHLARAYGVDLSQLVQRQPQQVAEHPDITALKAEMAALKGQLAQGSVTQQHDINQRVESFAKENPHFNDVRVLMGTISQATGEQDLAKLYNLACNAHPEVSAKIKADEQKAERIRKDREARAAAGKAVSIKASPPPPAGHAAPDNLRSTLEAAWEGRL